jgi:hypothetical protein
MNKYATFVISILLTLAAQCILAKENDGNRWKKCANTIYDELAKRGVAESGSPSQYLGANGAGVDIASVCGYKTMTKSLCGQIYKNSYITCIESEYVDENITNLSQVERGWISGLKNADEIERHIVSLCRKKTRISREKFSSKVCNL